MTRLGAFFVSFRQRYCLVFHENFFLLFPPSVNYISLRLFCFDRRDDSLVCAYSKVVQNSITKSDSAAGSFPSIESLHSGKAKNEAVTLCSFFRDDEKLTALTAGFDGFN